MSLVLPMEMRKLLITGYLSPHWGCFRDFLMMMARQSRARVEVVPYFFLLMSRVVECRKKEENLTNKK